MILPTGAGKSYVGQKGQPRAYCGWFLEQRVPTVGPQVYTKGITDLAGEYLADYVVERIKVSLTPEEEEYRQARGTFYNFIVDHGIVLDGLSGWHRFIRESAKSRKGRGALRAPQRAKKLALGTQAKLRTLDFLLKKHARERTIIFTSDNDTVYAISAAFLIPAITHQTATKERKTTLEAFNKGVFGTGNFQSAQ